MKKIIRKLKDSEKWKKELICVKNYPGIRRTDDILWHCSECNALYEHDDFMTLWTNLHDMVLGGIHEAHCSKCGSEMTNGSRKWFANNYLYMNNNERGFVTNVRPYNAFMVGVRVAVVINAVVVIALVIALLER